MGCREMGCWTFRLKGLCGDACRHTTAMWRGLLPSLLTHLDLGLCSVGTGLPLALALEGLPRLESLHLRISCNTLSGRGSLAQLAGLLQLRVLSLTIYAELANQGAAYAFQSANKSRDLQQFHSHSKMTFNMMS